jgi:hypothetical protein
VLTASERTPRLRHFCYAPAIAGTPAINRYGVVRLVAYGTIPRMSHEPGIAPSCVAVVLGAVGVATAVMPWGYLHAFNARLEVVRFPHSPVKWLVAVIGLALTVVAIRSLAPHQHRQLRADLLLVTGCLYALCTLLGIIAVLHDNQSIHNLVGPAQGERVAYGLPVLGADAALTILLGLWLRFRRDTK